MGWLYNKRSSKKVHFLELRDGAGILPCVVFQGDVSPEVFEAAARMTQETSLRVTGEVRVDKRSKIGFELGVSSLEVIAAPAAEYPITPKDHGVAFLMDHRHRWLRSRKQHAIMRVRHEIIDAIRGYFNRHGFTMVAAPRPR